MDDLLFEKALWQQEDADWERWQAAGLKALEMGNEKAGGEAIARALQVARQKFKRGDPRLAASLTSHASMLSRLDDPLAEKLFTEALDHWDFFRTWLDHQPLPKLARSSTFHVRLEAKHRGGYPNSARRHCLSLAAEGMVVTLTLADGGLVTRNEADRSWRPESQRNFDTLRKVSSAVRLLAF